MGGVGPGTRNRFGCRCATKVRHLVIRGTRHLRGQRGLVAVGIAAILILLYNVDGTPPAPGDGGRDDRVDGEGRRSGRLPRGIPAPSTQPMHPQVFVSAAVTALNIAVELGSQPFEEPKNVTSVTIGDPVGPAECANSLTSIVGEAVVSAMAAASESHAQESESNRDNGGLNPKDHDGDNQVDGVERAGVGRHPRDIDPDGRLGQRENPGEEKHDPEEEEDRKDPGEEEGEQDPDPDEESQGKDEEGEEGPGAKGDDTLDSKCFGSLAVFKWAAETVLAGQVEPTDQQVT
jgi:hypothetical protein